MKLGLGNVGISDVFPASIWRSSTRQRCTTFEFMFTP